MPTRLRSIFLAASLGCLFAATPLRAAPATADQKADEKRLQEGKEHFQAGQTHYSLGEFAEAAAEFREAYRLRPEPAILFNIAQAMRQMNDYRHAYFYYSQYLSHRPDAANRSAVEEFMTSMKQKMDEEDSLKAAQAQPLAAPPPEDKPVEKPADLRPPDATASSSAPAGEQHGPATAPAVAVISQPQPLPAPNRKTFWTGTHIGGVAVAGAGVAAGALAFVFHSSAQSSADTLNQKYQSGTLTAQDSSLKDDVSSKGKLATICLVSAAALLVAGGVLTFAF